MGISSSLGSSALLPAGLGFRNKVINGDMRISQRGTAGRTNDGAFETYFTDCWHVWGQQGAKMSINQSTVVPTGQGFTNSTVVTSLSALSVLTGHYYGLRQYIEGFNSADLAYGTSGAKPIVISFWVRSSIAGTYSLTLHNGATNRTYISTYTIDTINVWEKKTVYFPTGDVTGTWETGNGRGLGVWFDLGSSSSVNGTAGVWNSSLLTRTSGSTNWISTNGATFYITGVQLEQNYQPTPFEHRPIGVELSLCHRYFQRFPDPAAVGVMDAGGRATRMLFPLYTRMRAIPTTVMSGTFNFWNGASTGTAGSLLGTYNSLSHGQLDWNGGAGSQGQSVTMYTTGGSQFVDFNAEL